MTDRINVRQARIDNPLNDSVAYLFVNRAQAGWHAWWASLFEYLLALGPAALEWRHEPVQNVLVARPELTDVQRAAIVAFLKTAPISEVTEHRTLRRATELTPDKHAQVSLVYFADGVVDQ